MVFSVYASFKYERAVVGYFAELTTSNEDKEALTTTLNKMVKQPLIVYGTKSRTVLLKNNDAVKTMNSALK